jgi:hypothetical protein
MLLSGVTGSSKIQKHHLVPNNFIHNIHLGNKELQCYQATQTLSVTVCYMMHYLPVTCSSSGRYVLTQFLSYLSVVTGVV